ncbi:uncharacterized protein [Panulirus ornatus]|uniref:uncharacterized protein isoform X2 n=1 Tax=Panulirus ornatus TaxID=150431 RepID=UPI003A83AD1B
MSPSLLLDMMNFLYYVLLVVVLTSQHTQARFYIARYNTVPASSDHHNNQPRRLPYIMFPGEVGTEKLLYPSHGNQRLWQQQVPPTAAHYDKGHKRNHLHLEPPTRFGVLPNNYGNDPQNGYTTLHKDQVKYVVPPFTPGGRVNVAFQFWIPVSVGGLFLTGQELQEALRSADPTAHLSWLWANSTAGQTRMEHGIRRFLTWVVSYLDVYDQTVAHNGRRRRSLVDPANAWVPDGGEDPARTTRGSVPRSRDKRNPGEAEEGWVTIGGGGVDFTTMMESHDQRPRPAHSSRPNLSLRPSSSSSRPSSSSSSRPYPGTGPPSQDFPPSSEVKPPFSLTSFDDLPSGAAGGERGLDVTNRLSRLDYLFRSLHLQREECRRRLLCEVVQDPHTFAPLSDMITDETRLPGDETVVSQELLNTAEGSRLLSYIEAVRLGGDRSRKCEVYQYRCSMKAREVINTDILPIWREVVRWLTVKVLAQDASPNLLV